MTLTYKSSSKNGKTAYFSGAATTLRFPVSAFPDKTAPQSIEVADGIFAGPKVKLTKEQRAEQRKNQPKPTLIQRAEAAEARARKLRERANAEASGSVEATL